MTVSDINIGIVEKYGPLSVSRGDLEHISGFPLFENYLVVI
jgi:hypothetical protein